MLRNVFSNFKKQAVPLRHLGVIILASRGPGLKIKQDTLEEADCYSNILSL
jgi:hypothetical protein